MTLPNPICNCCGLADCVVTITGSDDIANYTDVSGTWTDSGTGVETSSANGLIYFDTTHPDNISTGAVRATITLPTTGAVRLILAYQDASNYIFAEWEIMGADCGAGVDCFNRIGHRTGGADTILEQLNGAQSATVEALLCYDGGRIALNYSTGTAPVAFGGTAVAMDSPLTGAWGDKVAFQVIGITGTATFVLEDFYGNADGSCVVCKPACTACWDGNSAMRETPLEVSVFLQTVADAACTSCDTIFDGATFLLPGEFVSATPDVDCEVHTSRDCTFYEEGAGCAAIPANDWTKLTISPSGLLQWKLDMIGGDGVFRFAFPGSNYCNQVLTHTSTSHTNTRCDWSGASAEITPNVA